MESVIKARVRDVCDPLTSSPGYDWNLLLRILILSGVFKLLLAVTVPIALDESYAIAVARQYPLSFFEHPPLSFWMPVAAADLMGINATLIYRLPFLLAGLATTWVMFLIGREIGGSRVGVWTALLFCAAPFFLVSVGVFAVPDGPLGLASAVVAFNLVRITKAGARAPLRFWVYAGIGTAFALSSKYQAAWLPLAVLTFMILHPKGRGWFAQPGPYLAGVIGLIGLVPVVVWNMQNDWITLSFHTERVSGGIHPGNFIGMLLVQSIFLLPVIFVVSVTGFWAALRKRIPPQVFMLAMVAIGPILMFNYVNLTSAQSHAHWSMPGWQFALPLAALWLKSRGPVMLRRVWRWMIVFFSIIWALLAVVVFQSDTGLLTRPFYDRAPDWDNTLSLFDFADLKPALMDRGLWDSTDVLMANSWAFGGILATAVASEKPMRIFDTAAAHHFIYLKDATATGSTLFMEPSIFRDTERSNAQTLASARTLDANAELLEPLILTRAGQPYVSVSIVRLTLK